MPFRPGSCGCTGFRQMARPISRPSSRRQPHCGLVLIPAWPGCAARRFPQPASRCARYGQATDLSPSRGPSLGAGCAGAVLALMARWENILARPSGRSDGPLPARRWHLTAGKDPTVPGRHPRSSLALPSSSLIHPSLHPSLRIWSWLPQTTAASIAATTSVGHRFVLAVPSLPVVVRSNDRSGPSSSGVRMSSTHCEKRYSFVIFTRGFARPQKMHACRGMA